MRKISKILILFAALASLIVAGIADASNGVQISPVTYNFEINPGETKASTVTITNRENEALNYIMETEIFKQSDESGVPSFSRVEPGEGVSSFIDWVVFEAGSETGTVEPKQVKVVNFTITVPENAEPGGHYGAIFARQVKKNAEGKTEVAVAARVGTLILISIPGDVDNSVKVLEFKSPKFIWRGPVVFKLRVENTGSVHYDSKGTANIKNIIGKSTTLEMGTHTILPGSVRAYEASWNNKYPFGYYKITPTATDGTGKNMTGAEVAVIAIPLLIVIPAVILIILLVIGILYLRRHVRFVKE